MLTAIRWYAFRAQCAWHFYFQSGMIATECWRYSRLMREFFDDPHVERPCARESVFIEMSYWEE
ncbi:hypothetical protein G6L78_01325 [Agrobacterium rhizogenes]|nr:hypothetical protein [Rhizobium rhizogenes]